MTTFDNMTHEDKNRMIRKLIDLLHGAVTDMWDAQQYSEAIKLDQAITYLIPDCGLMMMITMKTATLPAGWNEEN